jgi:hypothetical protein
VGKVASRGVLVLDFVRMDGPPHGGSDMRLTKLLLWTFVVVLPFPIATTLNGQSVPGFVPYRNPVPPLTPIEPGTRTAGLR